MTHAASFERFVERWDVRQGELLEELNTASAKGGLAMEEDQMRELIARALSQFEEYYEEKSRAAHRDVFQMLSPTWCSSLECAFYWLSGFRPSSILRLLTSVVHDLSPAQLFLVERLKAETRSLEKALSDEQARIQETLAAPPIVGSIRRVGSQQYINGDGGMQPDEAMEIIQAAMERLVTNADNLRTRAAAEAVAILTMTQSITFLEASIQVQQNMNVWGMGKHAPLGGKSNSYV